MTQQQIDSQQLAIGEIRRDGGTQPRAELDAPTLDEYTEIYAHGGTFPPVEVYYDGRYYWLADGFHRVEAALAAGLTEVAANVRQGDRRAAVLHSVGANAEHGLRRSNADKRRAVSALLDDPEWGLWSDRQIARQCRVSRDLVTTLRRELSGGSAGYDAGVRMVQRGDSVYTMQTAARYVTGEPLLVAIRPIVIELAQRAGVLASEVLYQIGLDGSPVGAGHLTALLERLASVLAPALCRPEDVRAQCAAWLSEVSPPERVTVWQLEQAVREIIGGWSGNSPSDRLLTLESVLARQESYRGLYGLAELEAALAALLGGRQYVKRELIQALHNVREQERQRQVGRLRQTIYKFIRFDPAPDAAPADLATLREAARLTASLLDLEGFHAQRGYNFDFAALLGQVDLYWRGEHAALRREIEGCRAVVLARLEQAESTAAAAAAEPEPEEDVAALGAAALAGWLASLAEENEVPTDRNGAPEPDAVRMIYRAIINDRSGSGVLYYRRLLRYTGWPTEWGEIEKLAAVRRELAALSAGAQTERRAPSWAGVRPMAGGRSAPRSSKEAIGALIARKDQHISTLVRAIEGAIAYINGGAFDDPAARADVLTVLRAAQAAALNED